MVASKKRFRIGVQSDPVEFISWLLNTLHADLGGTKKSNSSIIYKCFQVFYVNRVFVIVYVLQMIFLFLPIVLEDMLCRQVHVNLLRKSQYSCYVVACQVETVCNCSCSCACICWTLIQGTCSGRAKGYKGNSEEEAGWETWWGRCTGRWRGEGGYQNFRERSESNAFSHAGTWFAPTSTFQGCYGEKHYSSGDFPNSRVL